MRPWQQSSGGDNHCGEDQRLAEWHVFGNQEGCGKGDHPTQTRPANHQRVRPWSGRGTGVLVTAEQERTRAEDPEQPNGNDTNQTAAQNPAIRSPASSDLELASMIPRACRPMSKNTVFSSRNWMVAQFTRSLSRDWTRLDDGRLVAEDQPAVTTAMTPEP